MLSCPRCQSSFEYSCGETPEWLRCPKCDFEFRFSEFQRQLARETQRAAWPGDPKYQRLLSDIPHERTERSVSMSFGEWIRWKAGHRRTTDRLLIRTAVHELVRVCCRLGQLYPAVPRGLRTRDDVQRFWRDPHHRFVLDDVEFVARDASFIVEDQLRKHNLGKDELRHIVDRELPHAFWVGLGIATYSPGKPEIRGILLALALLRARGSDIPNLLLELEQWFQEEGWAHYGSVCFSDTASGR